MFGHFDLDLPLLLRKYLKKETIQIWEVDTLPF